MPATKGSGNASQSKISIVMTLIRPTTVSRVSAAENKMESECLIEAQPRHRGKRSDIQVVTIPLYPRAKEAGQFPDVLWIPGVWKPKCGGLEHPSRSQGRSGSAKTSKIRWYYSFRFYARQRFHLSKMMDGAPRIAMRLPLPTVRSSPPV